MVHDKTVYPPLEPSEPTPLEPQENDPVLKRRLVLAAALAFLTVLLLGMNLSRAPEGPGLGERVQNSLERYWQDFRNWRHGPVRVGIQIGHYQAEAHPDELAILRINTGATAGGITEVGVNQAVAERMRELLKPYGILVDLLPATVPPGYRADLVVALHADSNLDPRRRGYKSAHFEPARNRLEAVLKAHIDEAYFRLTGLTDDHTNTTLNMTRYYAFNHRRYRHSVHASTPAVIVEMAYLSNPQERQFLASAARPAEALVAGVVNYLIAQGRLLDAEPR